jgi:glycosyltransferase involved in cell wall biosynthesis
MGIQCGITHYPIGWCSRMFSQFLFRRMHTQLYATSELEWMRSFFGIPADLIEANPFGVDTFFWTPGKQSTVKQSTTISPYVLAVGNDAQRDYDTLIQTAEGAPWRLILVTHRPLPAALPENVKIVRGSYTEGIDDTELRDLYRKAACVVVPLKPGLQPSGQSVTLQAMACGVTVVLTRTEGLFDTARLQNGKQLLLVEPENPKALRSAIERLLTDEVLRNFLTETGRDYVLRHCRIEDFAGRLEQLCQRVVNDKKGFKSLLVS